MTVPTRPNAVQIRMSFKEKLQEYALIAEIVSAIAIIGSLIFVGLEIRQNTNATFATSYDQLLADQMDLRLRIANNPAIIMAFEEFREVEDVNDMATLDHAVGLGVNIALYQLYERAYFSRNYGRLGDAEWNRYMKNICAPDSVGIINKTDPIVFSDEFWDYVHECSGE